MKWIGIFVRILQRLIEGILNQIFMARELNLDVSDAKIIMCSSDVTRFREGCTVDLQRADTLLTRSPGMVNHLARLEHSDRRIPCTR